MPGLLVVSTFLVEVASIFLMDVDLVVIFLMLVGVVGVWGG